jgi:hypothetical protein
MARLARAEWEILSNYFLPYLPYLPHLPHLPHPHFLNKSLTVPTRQQSRQLLAVEHLQVGQIDLP